MKNHSLRFLTFSFLLFTLPVFLFSQSKVFTATKSNPDFDQQLATEFHQVQSFILDGNSLRSHINDPAFDNSFKLKVDESNQWEFELYPFTLFAEDGVIRALTPSGEQLYQAPQNVSFKGYVKDEPSKVVTLIIHGTHIFGIITDGITRTYLASANKYIKDAPKDMYLLFNEEDQKAEEIGHCGFDNYPEFNLSNNQKQNEVQGGNRLVDECYRVELGVVSDYLMYQDQGSTIQGCVDHVLDVMADVATNYELNGSTNFDDGIVYWIVEQVISTCNGCDAWTSSTDPDALLNSFTSWAQNGGFTKETDMGSFWTNRNFNGSTIGLAWTGENLLCTDNAYHVLQDYTNNAADLRVLTAHEMGHNWSALHSSGCIMNDEVNGSTCWATSSKNAINPEIASQGPTCLDVDCPASTCDSLVNVVISNVTSTGFTISYTGTSDNAYRIQVRDEEDKTIIHTELTSSENLTINPTEWQDCKSYMIIAENDCGSDDYGPATSALVDSPDPGACADFSAEKTICWANAPIQFIDNSSNATSWNWDFGDSGTSSAQNPSHTYSTAGIYTVSLSINGGTTTRVRTNYIEILPQEALPYTIAEGGNMETDDFGTRSLTSGKVSLWEKGIPSNYFNNSTNCWVTDLDADMQNTENVSALYSPCFDFSDPGTATLRFDLGMEHGFCNAPFGTQVQYSTNDGDSWTRLGANTDPGWYNRGPGSGCSLATTIFTDEIGWSFTNQSTNYDYDVSFLTGGGTVVFRIVFSLDANWNNGYNRDGAMIDNFEIEFVPDAPQPVELIYFNGQKEADKVRLEWGTQIEINNDYFLIERSMDGRDFYPLGTIEGNGTTNFSNDYFLIDNRPLIGFNYYRLTQFDFDGSYEVFDKIVAVEFYGEDQIAVRPNPVRGNSLELLYNSNRSEELFVDIINASGQFVRRLNLQTSYAQSIFEINIADLSAGVYFLRTTQLNDVQILRFVKTKQ